MLEVPRGKTQGRPVTKGRNSRTQAYGTISSVANQQNPVGEGCNFTIVHRREGAKDSVNRVAREKERRNRARAEQDAVGSEEAR
jgi:hypothetical protein